jgi:hypothetical protein
MKHSKQPQASIHLEIPDCRMEATVTSDGYIFINLGRHDDVTTLIFQRRRALRRLIRVAADILAAPGPDNTRRERVPEIVSSPD